MTWLLSFCLLFYNCYCVCVKHIMLCHCVCSSSSLSSFRFSASRVRDFGIVNRYSWFWKSLNMADWGGEFSFIQSINVKNGVRIDISIFIIPMTTELSELVHLGELTKMRLIKQLLVILSLYLYYQTAYDHQIWQDGNLPWWAAAHKFTWPLGHVILRDHLIN